MNDLHSYFNNSTPDMDDEICGRLMVLYCKKIKRLGRAFVHNLDIYDKLVNDKKVTCGNYELIKTLLFDCLHNAPQMSTYGQNGRRIVLTFLNSYVTIYRANEEVYKKIEEVYKKI